MGTKIQQEEIYLVIIIVYVTVKTIQVDLGDVENSSFSLFWENDGFFPLTLSEQFASDFRGFMSTSFPYTSVDSWFLVIFRN